MSDIIFLFLFMPLLLPHIIFIDTRHANEIAMITMHQKPAVA